MTVHPSSTKIGKLNWIPDNLRMLMSNFTKSELKQEAIGQRIVKLANPNRSMLPLLFRLAVELDYLYGSKRLIDELYRLGFKQAVMSSQSLDDHKALL